MSEAESIRPLLQDLGVPIDAIANRVAIAQYPWKRSRIPTA